MPVWGWAVLGYGVLFATTMTWMGLAARQCRRMPPRERG